MELLRINSRFLDHYLEPRFGKNFNLCYTIIYGGQIDPRGINLAITLWNVWIRNFLWWLFLNIRPCQNSICHVRLWSLLVTLWRHFCDVIASNFFPKHHYMYFCLFASSLDEFFSFLMFFGRGIHSNYSQMRDLYGWPWNSRSRDVVRDPY